MLWDSSAILAFLDADDGHHDDAMESAAREVSKLDSFITNYVQAEAHALILTRVGRALAHQWLLGSRLPVWSATPAEEATAKRLIAEHPDKDWSLCDAISFAVIEARGAKGAFTFDRHFRQRGGFRLYGLK